MAVKQRRVERRKSRVKKEDTARMLSSEDRFHDTRRPRTVWALARGWVRRGGLGEIMVKVMAPVKVRGVTKLRQT